VSGSTVVHESADRGKRSADGGDELSGLQHSLCHTELSISF
jgi:hypothetical protein